MHGAGGGPFELDSYFEEVRVQLKRDVEILADSPTLAQIVKINVISVARGRAEGSDLTAPLRQSYSEMLGAIPAGSEGEQRVRKDSAKALRYAGVWNLLLHAVKGVLQGNAGPLQQLQAVCVELLYSVFAYTPMACMGSY